MPVTVAQRSAPGFLQVVGHPLRWRLLAELAMSDRTVRELCAQVGEPQNLVSYHLRQLRDAELVTSRRSAADGRDAYYRARVDRVGSGLAAAGAALHPGLATTAPPLDRRRVPRSRVLFLCTGNSSRSQMAEALARHRSGGRVAAFSAGSHPKPVHPEAVRVLRDRFSIDASAQRPDHLDRYAADRFDRVVTLCDRVRERCPELPGGPPAIHWSMPDPSAGLDPDDRRAARSAFETAGDEIAERVDLLLADLAAASPDHRPPEGP